MQIDSLWPDGSLISATSWHELEEEIRARQWRKYSRNEFRRELRRRTEIMTGTVISVRTPERMFRGMEEAGMVRLEVREEDDDATNAGGG